MKTPSMEARADRVINDRADEIGLAPAPDEALEASWRNSYAAGFAAALAMLANPSDMLVSDILGAAKHNGVINLREALRAAASALADIAEKEGNDAV